MLTLKGPEVRAGCTLGRARRYPVVKEAGAFSHRAPQAIVQEPGENLSHEGDGLIYDCEGPPDCHLRRMERGRRYVGRPVRGLMLWLRRDDGDLGEKGFREQRTPGDTQ